jgi:uncharacterized protein (TIGR02186 family)
MTRHSFKPKDVIAGLIPAIHELRRAMCSWMAGTLAGHDDKRVLARRYVRLHLLFLAAMIFAVPAHADDLVSGLSTDLIQITSNFTGTDIVLFGAIEPTEDAGPAKDQDLVIVVRGPQIDMTVRRKERMVGIWVNRDQIVFTGLPGYYFLASTRPLDDIASLPTLQRFRLGTANLESTYKGNMDADKAAAFRAAAIRDRKRERLYWESPTGIEFLSRTLFRARITVPASVPPGEYRAEAYLFQDGTVVSAQSSPLFIDKSGFERRVYNYAYQASFAYGFAAVLMAFAFGWAGFLIFRQR